MRCLMISSCGLSNARPVTLEYCASKQKPMKCGVLLARKRTSSGSVWHSILQPSRCLPFMSAIGAVQSAKQLWKRIPSLYREQAAFYTDAWAAYKEVIPAARHRICAKSTGRTNSIERFNCSLRQRVSRLVRDALSFSKKLAHHIGAIKYFICHYNQEASASITFS